LIDDAFPNQTLEEIGETGQTAVRISDFGGPTGAAIEDLMPLDDIAAMMDRVERRPERLFVDTVVAGLPFQVQVLNWAKSHDIVLMADWRVQLAERMRKWLLERDDPRVSEEILARWLTLMHAVDTV
jgi:hypothetical protein